MTMDADKTASPLNFYGLKCPNCQYNLAGLSKSVCPECGEWFNPLQIGQSEYSPQGRVLAILSVMLVVLGMSAFMGFANTGCRLRTNINRSTIHMAKGLSTEYRAQFGYAINHDPSALSPIDWTIPKTMNAPGAVGSGIPNDSIEKFVWAVWQVEELRDRLQSKALSDVVVDSDGDGFLELVDGWGNKIEYAAYVNRGDAYTADDHLPAIQTPIFLSPGADGLLGTYVPVMSAPGSPRGPVNQPDGDAADNVRSDAL
jgi:hypothetical protein